MCLLPRTAPNAIGAIRHSDLHEYLSMELMKQHEISTPAGFVGTSTEEVENIFLNKINKMVSVCVCVAQDCDGCVDALFSRFLALNSFSMFVTDCCVFLLLNFL